MGSMLEMSLPIQPPHSKCGIFMNVLCQGDAPRKNECTFKRLAWGCPPTVFWIHTLRLLAVLKLLIQAYQSPDTSGSGLSILLAPPLQVPISPLSSHVPSTGAPKMRTWLKAGRMRNSSVKPRVRQPPRLCPIIIICCRYVVDTCVLSQSTKPWIILSLLEE